MRRAELDGRLVETVPTDDRFRRETDVGAKASLERAHVDRAQAREVVDADNRSTDRDALDQVANAFEVWRWRTEPWCEERFCERDLLFRVVRRVDGAGPGTRGLAEKGRERHDAIGDARHRSAEERAEHHRPEADAEGLAFAGERAGEGTRRNAENDGASFGGGGDAENLCGGVRKGLAAKGRAE